MPVLQKRGLIEEVALLIKAMELRSMVPKIFIWQDCNNGGAILQAFGR
jgi:hypothetical protein